MSDGAHRRVSTVAAHLTAAPAAAAAPAYHTLDTPHGPVAFPCAFLRENIDTAWDASSLQRTAFRMWGGANRVAETTRLSDTSWRLRFEDGAVGAFHLPSTSPYFAAVDIEARPQQLWGEPTGDGRVIPGAHLWRKLATPHATGGGGGIRFHWDELGVVGDGTAGLAGLAAEQLGEGRARLPRGAARARSALIEAVHTYGMAIIDGVPCQPDQGILFADSVVGACETTNFGYKFVIKSVRDAHNLAFDNIYLQHHTDFTYCRKCPDVALFHCLNNADKGGDSLWLDGFACAEELRRTDPAAFELLTKVQVRHMDITDKWDLQASHPTIEVDHGTGEIQRIYFNERTRDSWRAWNDAQPQPQPQPQQHRTPGDQQCSPDFYAALKKFERIIEDRRFHINTPLQPGELVLFDNARVLHSRTAFEGERHMEGAYLEWGAAYATWRSLQPQIEGVPDLYCGNVVGKKTKEE